MAHGGEGGTSVAQEGIAIGCVAGGRQGLELGLQLLQQLGTGGLIRLGQAGQDRRAAGVQQRLAAAHRARQGCPAFGPQIVAGALQPVLQVLEVSLLNRQGIAQDGGRIGHGVTGRQGGPGRGPEGQAGEQQCECHPQGTTQGPRECPEGGAEGEPALEIHAAALSLPGLWHSRMIPPEPFGRDDLEQRLSHRHDD